MSLDPSLKVEPQEFIVLPMPPVFQPAPTSVFSSAIKDIVLAVIGRAESNFSKRCMRRLAEVTREHDQAGKRLHIQQCFRRLAIGLAGPRSAPNRYL